MTSLFCCPICGAPLAREERVYRCAAGHSYDIAKEGYTHLLPPNRKHSAAPGDDKGMAAARRDFLSKGYSNPTRSPPSAMNSKDVTVCLGCTQSGSSQVSP